MSSNDPARALSLDLRKRVHDLGSLMGALNCRWYLLQEELKAREVVVTTSDIDLILDEMREAIRELQDLSPTGPKVDRSSYTALY